GFERAREFVSLLVEEFRLSAQRCVFVPGNHDVQDLESSFDWYGSTEKARKVEPDETRWHREGSLILLPTADYPLRLKKFSDAFYHKVLQEPYPLEPERQVVAYLFPDTRIQFLALNSCWQIDGFHRKRSGVHPDAVARGIEQADRQVKEAKERGDLDQNATV